MDRVLQGSLVALLLWMGLLHQLVNPVLGVPNKCTACQAVAGEIEAGLANERPRNHLDLRHRLDSKGQREGKVIDYKVSELRVVELLDGLCSKFKSYTLQKAASGEEKWVKVDLDKLSDEERQKATAIATELVSYCGRLVDTTDDELSNKIQKGLVKAGDVESILCIGLSGHCKPPSKCAFLLDVKKGYFFAQNVSQMPAFGSGANWRTEVAGGSHQTRKPDWRKRWRVVTQPYY